MYMTNDLHKNLCMKILLNKVSYQYFKAIMLLLLLMVKLELVKHIQWKALNIILAILKEVSYQGVWRKFSNSFKCNPARIPPLWFVLVTSRFTMRSFRIFSRLKGPHYKLEKTKNVEYSLKVLVNGRYDHPMKCMR